jgi:dihydropteroate synthase-like protein
MPPNILFLTGHLAEPRLRRVLSEMNPTAFSWEVRDIGIQVAALMTTELIRRRLLPEARHADRIVVPGFCAGDLAELGTALGVAVERGPEDVHDLPAHFGGQRAGADLTRHDVRIFAEIIDAPRLTVAAIVAKGRELAADGADVIDLGCLPQTPFPHLEEAVAALHAAGLAVSVDSAEVDELRRGGRAGADYVFSLSAATLGLAAEMRAVPVIIPAAPGDLDSLCAAAATLAASGRACILDPILDPIPFGLAASFWRYAELRRRLPEQRILMGIGNLTELTEADTAGINAILFGIIAELGITDVLAVQKSPHCRTAIREADRARRIMHAATTLGRLPVGIDTGLSCLRDRKPFATTPQEVAETAGAIRDRNYRIEIAEDGIHVYNRDGHHVARDADSLFAKLDLGGDAAHAFYLGAELAKAQIAFDLGKRYVQDEALHWGVAVREAARDRSRHQGPGATLKRRPRGSGETPE